MAAQVTLRLVEGMRFDAVTPAGHVLPLDSVSVPGEAGAGPSPTQLVLAALGACGAMDVVSILRKMRQGVTSYEVIVTGERAEEHPRVYTSIDVRHVVRGAPLAAASVQRAIQLSITRYCPVYAMLSRAVPISVRFEMTDEATSATVERTVEPEVAGEA